MNNKIILYLGGGSMSGIFGAGVVTSLQKMNFYDKIEAIYAGSAGVMNGSYFLAGQSELGSSAYYEDLTQNFISPLHVPIGIIQRFWNKYINELSIKKIRNVVDIDYIIDIIKNKKQLKIKNIKKQKIKFYAKLLNVSNGNIDYVDVKRYDTLTILKAAISIAPYYFPSQKIKDGKYIDGTIKEPIGLRYILNKHIKNKIVVVINEPIMRGFRHYAKNFLEGLVASSMHKSLFKFFIEREKSVRNDIKLALNDGRVLLIHPPKNNPTLPKTTDYSKLMATYKMGIKEAEKIKDFID